MPLNIITRSKTRKVSDSEVAHHMAKVNEEAAIREKHTYKERSRQIRKAAENLPEIPGMKARAVYDSRTYFRHEQERPGCMSDPTYTKELLRDNEEMRL